MPTQVQPANQVQSWLGRYQNPEDWGWKKHGKISMPKQASKPPAPPDLMKSIFCRCKGNCGSMCGCRKAGLKCSTVCLHCSGETCSNIMMGAKWCSMAKVCNHDRVPICGLSHAGDIMGFRDLCDMFDYNCIRRRNYKQTPCPDDRAQLTVSRRPTNSYYDD